MMKNHLTQQFDAGAAWENLALQGQIQGYCQRVMSSCGYYRSRFDGKDSCQFDATEQGKTSRDCRWEDGRNSYFKQPYQVLGWSLGTGRCKCENIGDCFI